MQTCVARGLIYISSEKSEQQKSLITIWKAFLNLNMFFPCFDLRGNELNPMENGQKFTGESTIHFGKV